MFTEFKFSPAQISADAAAAALSLSAARPGVNAAKFAADTIGARLLAKPETYFQYGPYWWAVKGALRELGKDFGGSDDEVIRGEYGAEFPTYGTLIAAEQFRDHYNATFLQGTAQFDLDGDGDQSYILFDPDMEIRIIGARDPLSLADALRAQPVEAETLLDGVAPSGPDVTLTPYAVRFEYEAALWTANVYAPDADAAKAKVQVLESTGRMSRAIDFGKATGESALDSTDISPLFIDRGTRTVSELAATGRLAQPE